ncbi:MAG: hypothetical protein IJF17_02760 [Thermoguttaceae bacterium]|nr:hypothetical protein [Thermoguttaceae bacterium]
MKRVIFTRRFSALLPLFLSFLAIPHIFTALAAADMPTRGLCAHRGDNACFPENTIPAFQSAARKGAQMVEMDVKRCRTGELIIMHDATVDRTTNGTGNVSALTFAEIRALDAGIKKNSRFAGTKVPTFEEAIDCLPKDGLWINVHCGGSVAVEVAQILKNKGRLHQAFIAASLGEISKARQVVPEILACNMSRPGGHGKPWTAEQSSLYASQTVENKCEFLQLLAPCSEDDAILLHDSGVKINYFHCNKPENVEKLVQMGADFLLTDRLEEIQKKIIEFWPEVKTEDK